MNHHEQFSEFDRHLREEFQPFGLLLNVRETFSFAEKLHASNRAQMKEANRSSRKRYILSEAPNRYIPVATKRIIVEPDSEVRLFQVDRMIIRVPDNSRSVLPVDHPNDVFIETVTTEGERSRHLLNGTGLWLYRDKEDLMLATNYSDTNDIFTPTNGAIPLPHRMQLASRILEAYLPALQTSANTEQS